MTLQEIKESKETLIGKQVYYFIIDNGNILKTSATLKGVRIVEESKMVLAYFEENNVCINALCISETKPDMPWEVIKEEF